MTGEEEHEEEERGTTEEPGCHEEWRLSHPKSAGGARDVAGRQKIATVPARPHRVRSGTPGDRDGVSREEDVHLDDLHVLPCVGIAVPLESRRR